MLLVRISVCTFIIKLGQFYEETCRKCSASVSYCEMQILFNNANFASVYTYIQKKPAVLNEHILLLLETEEGSLLKYSILRFLTSSSLNECVVAATNIVGNNDKFASHKPSRAYQNVYLHFSNRDGISTYS